MHGSTSIVSVALCATALLATPRNARCQDAREPDDAIRWFLPGQFEDAVAAAKERRRLIMIKGIAFGIDKAGATSATKGKW